MDNMPGYSTTAKSTGACVTCNYIESVAYSTSRLPSVTRTPNAVYTVAPSQFAQNFSDRARYANEFSAMTHSSSTLVTSASTRTKPKNYVSSEVLSSPIPSPRPSQLRPGYMLRPAAGLSGVLSDLISRIKMLHPDHSDPIIAPAVSSILYPISTLSSNAKHFSTIYSQTRSKPSRTYATVPSTNAVQTDSRASTTTATKNISAVTAESTINPRPSTDKVKTVSYLPHRHKPALDAKVIDGFNVLDMDNEISVPKYADDRKPSTMPSEALDISKILGDLVDILHFSIYSVSQLNRSIYSTADATSGSVCEDAKNTFSHLENAVNKHRYAVERLSDALKDSSNSANQVYGGSMETTTTDLKKSVEEMKSFIEGAVKLYDKLASQAKTPSPDLSGVPNSHLPISKSYSSRGSAGLRTYQSQ